MIKHKILLITLLLFSFLLTECIAEELSDIEKEQIFKDKLGFDTGMTNEELDVFKNKYALKLENLGLKKFPIFYVRSYQSKLNLLKIDELRNLGFPFDSLSIYHTPSTTQLLDILMSDLIVVGTIDKIEYLFKTKDDELNAKSHIKSKYHIKVEEILKNNLKDEINELFSYSCKGKYVWCSDGANYLLNSKYLMYINLDYNPIEDKNELIVRHHSSLEIDNDELFFPTKSKYIRKFSEMKSIIKKYIEINDTENFYNRDYNTKSEE
ncbi:MAG: hypothetical protein PHH62_05615 [Endomicrobiaceae bacterium]|nr:hypothetical protein [Endomicrobiaceae bacterium]